MASIWRHPSSPFYMACFTAIVGASLKQFKKTTATSDRKLARRIADEVEEAAHGRRTSEQIKAFLVGITDLKARRAAQHTFDFALRQTVGIGLETKTARGFVTGWLDRTKNEVSPGTWVKYEQIANQFLSSLGGKADQDMNLIRQEDIARYRDEQAKRVAPTTANVMLKIVRVIFTAAEADGVVTRNEATHVKRLKVRNAQSARRAFTLPELRSILSHCDDEWRSLIIFGFYTGARLGDLAMMTWQNIDLTQKEIRFVSRKTGRQIIIPMAAPLLQHIEELPAGDNPMQPVHPRAFEIMERNGNASMLSNQFADILASAGLAPARSHQVEDSKRKGRGSRRVVNPLSFHSLRHTAVSLLKNAGVSDAVAQDLVGHESAEISRLYTHIEDKTKREALNKLPSLDTSKRKKK